MDETTTTPCAVCGNTPCTCAPATETPAAMPETPATDAPAA